MTSLPRVRHLPHSKHASLRLRVALTLALAGLLLLVTARSASPQRSDRAAADEAAWLQDVRLVFSASRYAQDVREAPASVTIITAAEIQRYGYRTLADVLGAARGIFTHNDRAYEYVTIRGISRQSDYNTRVQLLVDGQRLNDAATDAGGIGTDGLIDLDLIDHVEIIHGPGSALFGTSAFFGVVNLVTKRGRNLAGIRATAAAGSFETYRGALSWGGRSGAAELLVAGSVEQRGGRDLFFAAYDDSSTNNGVAAGLDGSRTYRSFVKAALGDLSLSGSYSHRDRDVPTGAYGVIFNDSRSHIRDGAATAVLSYEHPFEDLSRLTLSASYNWYGYDGAYPYVQTLFRDFNHSHTTSLAGQYLRLLGAGSKLTFGARLGWVADAEIGAYDVEPRQTFVSLDRSLITSALFTQFEWRLGSNLISYTGVRYDHYPSFGGTINPRTSLVYRPFSGTWLKAHYGRAFRAPNLYELYYEDGGVTQKAAHGLKPEHVATTEVSLEQSLGLGVRASLSAYRVRTTALINLVTDPLDDQLVYVNEGNARSSGIEVEVERSSRAGSEVRLAYGYQRARDDVVRAFVNSPRHILRAGASVPIVGDNGRLAMEVRHLSERLTLDGSDAPSYTLTNITLSGIGLGAGMELMGQARNVFGVRYVEPAGAEHAQNELPGDRREFRVGLRRRF